MSNDFIKLLRQDKGFSLVEIMIAGAIMCAIALGTATYISSQVRENKSLTEKLGALDLTRSVLDFLANNRCDSILDPANIEGGATKLTFDANSLSSSPPYIINLNHIGSITKNSQASLISSSLYIEAHGIQLHVKSKTSAELVIGFNSAKLVRPLKQLQFPLAINTTGPASATLIEGCGAGWQDVALDDTSDFDVNCDYRLYFAGGDYVKPTFVSKGALIAPASSRQFVLQKVLASDKEKVFYTLAGDAAINTCHTAPDNTLAFDSTHTYSISCSSPAQTPLAAIKKKCL